MQYRTLGNTGIALSTIGFGCMRLPSENRAAIPLIRRAVDLGINYFETSITYCQNRSEVQLGLALDGRWDDVYISTKSHVSRQGERGFGGVAERDSTGEDFTDNLEESLRKLGTDRVDFYQFHSFKAENLPVAMAEGGPFEALQAAKDEGRIGHIGFTSHDTPANLIKILDTGAFESMTVYHNLLQTRGRLENPLPAIEHARTLGVGVIVMGPLGGGLLGTPIDALRDLIPDTASQVELAFRYLWSIPGVTTPISGMARMRDVEENVRIASACQPLSDDAMTRIQAVIGQYTAVVERFCTGCGYCQPCPNGVRVPRIFRLVNLARVYGLHAWARQQYRRMLSGRFRGGADLCVACGACEEQCPQHLNIRDELTQAHASLSSGGG